jgi:hypothetical protein
LFFLTRSIKPIKDGISTLMKNRNIEALKPTEADSPSIEIKNTEAPSLIPNSPKETGGIIVLANMIRLPAHK